MSDTREVTLKVNVKAPPNAFKALEDSAKATTTQVLDRLSQIQKKLQDSGSFKGVASEKLLDVFNVSKLDRAVGRSRQMIEDNLAKLQRRMSTMKLDADPAPLLMTLRRTQLQATQMQKAVLGLAGAGMHGLGMAGGGLMGVGQNLSLLADGDKGMEKMVMKTIQLSAAFGLLRSGKEVIVGLVGGFINLGKAITAMGSAAKAASAVGAVSDALRAALIAGGAGAAGQVAGQTAARAAGGMGSSLVGGAAGGAGAAAAAGGAAKVGGGAVAAAGGVGFLVTVAAGAAAILLGIGAGFVTKSPGAQDWIAQRLSSASAGKSQADFQKEHDSGRQSRLGDLATEQAHGAFLKAQFGINPYREESWSKGEAIRGGIREQIYGVRRMGAVAGMIPGFERDSNERFVKGLNIDTRMDAYSLAQTRALRPDAGRGAIAGLAGGAGVFMEQAGEGTAASAEGLKRAKEAENAAAIRLGTIKEEAALAKGENQTIAEKQSLLDRMAKAEAELLQTEVQKLEATRAHGQAQLQNLTTSRQQVIEQKKFWTQQIQVEKDKQTGDKRALGGMNFMEQKSTLDITKKLLSGQTLSSEEIGRISGIDAVQQPLNKYLEKRGAGTESQISKLVGDAGYATGATRQSEAEKMATLFEKMRVELNTKISATLEFNEQSLADQLAKVLAPAIQTAIMNLEKTLATKLADLQKQIDVDKANKRNNA